MLTNLLVLLIFLSIVGDVAWRGLASFNGANSAYFKTLCDLYRFAKVLEADTKDSAPPELDWAEGKAKEVRKLLLLLDSESIGDEDGAAELIRDRSNWVNETVIQKNGQTRPKFDPVPKPPLSWLKATLLERERILDGVKAAVEEIRKAEGEISTASGTLSAKAKMARTGSSEGTLKALHTTRATGCAGAGADEQKPGYSIIADIACVCSAPDSSGSTGTSLCGTTLANWGTIKSSPETSMKTFLQGCDPTGSTRLNGALIRQALFRFESLCGTSDFKPVDNNDQGMLRHFNYARGTTSSAGTCAGTADNLNEVCVNYAQVAKGGMTGIGWYKEFDDIATKMEEIENQKEAVKSAKERLEREWREAWGLYRQAQEISDKESLKEPVSRSATSEAEKTQLSPQSAEGLIGKPKDHARRYLTISAAHFFIFR